MNKRKFLRTDEVRDITGCGDRVPEMCLTGKVTGAVKDREMLVRPVDTLKTDVNEERRQDAADQRSRA